MNRKEQVNERREYDCIIQPAVERVRRLVRMQSCLE